jgi:hypothetical protein
MSGSDGTSPSTPVLAARCSWAPAIMCCHASHLKGAASRGPSSSGGKLILKRLPSMVVGGPGTCRAELRGGATAGGQAAKSCSLMAIEMGERISMNRAWV